MDADDALLEDNTVGPVGTNNPKTTMEASCVAGTATGNFSIRAANGLISLHHKASATIRPKLRVGQERGENVRRYKTCRGVRDCEVGRPGIKSGGVRNEDVTERTEMPDLEILPHLHAFAPRCASLKVGDNSGHTSSPNCISRMGREKIFIFAIW